ncbi:uncharacterized protein LOC143073656 [Mytilus galloprovincialis]|uniref:uncharacterized protein LOC143073656 n=1 Tax=Mytilus galloprovincialis TaxID=29158 RepID=UPI003F7B4388
MAENTYYIHDIFKVTNHISSHYAIVHLAFLLSHYAFVTFFPRYCTLFAYICIYRFFKMPRRKNWRAAEAKRGVKNPMKKTLTDLTGDTGPINSTRIDLDMGDTDTLNNSISNNMGDTDLHTNINNSNSNNMGDTDLHTNINNSNLKLLEKSELNKLEISELNILEISELNELEISELDKLEVSELNQNSNNNCAKELNQNSNNNCAKELNQNSNNNCAKETCQMQTDFLSHESNNHYAKTDSHSNIQTDLLQNQNEQYKNNSEEELSKNVNSFNANFLKFGTFDQYATKFAAQSRGNQCTCNCLVFLSLSSLNFDSNTLNLDYILNKGDEIYRKHVQELTTQGLFKNMLLNFDEIPVKIEIPEGIFIVNKQNILFGIALQYQELTGFLSLQEAIQNCMKQSNKFLIMIGAICSAVYYYNHIYYLFDTHSHSECTLNNPLDSSGKSILIGFADLHDLLSYLYAFYTSLQIDLDSQYEILPVSISSTDTEKDVTKQIKNYFDDQKLRNTKQTKNSYQYMKVPKFVYMKNYMQNRRKNKKFKEKELNAMQNKRKNKKFKEKELNAKRYSRKDTHYRKTEADRKKSQRDNSDLRQIERQRELVAKRKVRKDEHYRRAEAESKKSQRDNSDLRQIERQRELVAKREVRKDEHYRRAEAESKKSQRDNSDLRQIERQRELAAKREVRKDEHYRRAEAESKKSQRDNSDFRQIERQRELVAKREVRKDEHYRRAEAESKKSQRDNSDFRQIERQRELVAKREARKNEDFNKRELAAKREARKNDVFKRNEKEKKNIARQDEDYRKHESERDYHRKQEYRSHPENLENERLKKQGSRQNKLDIDRCYDKTVKSTKRKNVDFTDHEKKLKKKRVQGITLDACIRNFKTKINHGPTYICTSCEQTWFCDSVVNSKTVKMTTPANMSHCFTNFKSVLDIEWICHTCLNAIKKQRIPRFSIANKMGFPQRPKELNLYPLEERLLSLRIPFMQIRQLPRGGQLSVKGNVVNVPVEVQPTINSLPHTIEKSGTISVKLKKKLEFKKCDFSENVRPFAVICALHYLMRTSDLYKSSGIEINDDWITEIAKINEEETQNENNSTEQEDNQDQNDSDDDSDHFSEVDGSETHVGNTDTLLDHIPDDNPLCDAGLTFAPGEGQRPISLYSDPDAEYLSFPTIFCGQRRPDNKDRSVSVHYTDIVKWELRSMDRRVAQSVPNIFFKLKKIQLKNISDKVNLALRRCQSEGKQWTAKDVLNPNTVNDLVRLDEGYYIFRSLRNSPVYLEKRKKDLFAMIRQLGLPTWFGSLSSADTNWKDLLRILGKLNDGKEYTDKELEEMDWHQKSKLVQKDPVTCSRYFDYRVQQFINLVLKSDHDPIGKLTDFFYRVEFQQRGSPHIHILIWIENAPVYESDSNEDVVAFIDKYVSCSLLENDSLVNLQIHKHSKTCRKKGHPICRFGFPLPPMKATVILEPLGDNDDIEKHKAIYKEIQNEINSLHNSEDIDQMTYDMFLDDVLQMNDENYIKAIRSNLSGPKVFLKRKPSEVRVNGYMKTVLVAWQANHDLQFVLDAFACAVYIVSYISKSQKGMSALLDQAAKEARQGNLDLKHQVRHIGNYFSNSVETSAQEATYLTLQMPLTKATRQVVFINTSPCHKRTFLLKQSSALEKLGPDSTEIESDNDIKRYSRRPKQLENWCLADYVSELEFQYPKTSQSSDDHETEQQDHESESENEEVNADVLEETDNKIDITLKNGIRIYQRKTPKVIRYVKYNYKTDSENFYRERLMLFYPWRNELSDLQCGHETFEKKYLTVARLLEKKAKQYEGKVIDLEKAIEEAENECNENDQVAPATQQVEMEDAEIGPTESEQYVHFNPDRPTEHRLYDMSREVGIEARTVELTNHANRISETDYFGLIRSLNKKQWEFFQHVVTWVKTKHEPFYTFLTGGAGCGKSVVVRAIFQALHRHLCSIEGEDPDDIRILLCAPTGKAAYNINGLTIHNAFQIQPNKGLDQSLSCDVLNTLRMKYRNLSLILIDEISMVGNKMFSLLERRLKKIKGSNCSFGGVSIIAIGDFFQLQPVFDSWIFNDLSKGLTALAPNYWKLLFSFHELTEIMRQKDDLEFALLLNRLRQNQLTENDFAILSTRTVSISDPTYRTNATHLFVENALVDNFNLLYISKLGSQKVNVKAVDTVCGDLPASVKTKLLSSLPEKQSDTANLAKEVVLAIGMKYDLTANIEVTDGLTNGSTCELKLIECKTTSLRPSIIWVKFEDARIGANNRKKYSHLYGKDVEKTWTPMFDIKRSFTYKYKTFERIQFPLRPAAGKTIHKSQGDTLHEVVVSLKSKRKGKIPHIHYVALSRVTSLTGLQILDLNKEAIAVADCVRQELDRLRTDATLQLCFNPLYNLSSNYFKVVFHNARSLHAHFNDLKSDPNILDADVIGIAESRLISTDKNDDFHVPGFEPPVRLDQQQTNFNTRPPHGLVLYYRNDCILHNTVTFSTPSLEFVIADIISPSKGLFQVVFVYKAPNCKLQQLKDTFLANLLPDVYLRHPKIIIMGDFNIDLNTGNTSFLKFMIDSFCCSQIVSKPTTSYGTLLDLIFLNFDSRLNFETDVLDSYWSDHKVIYVAIETQ